MLSRVWSLRGAPWIAAALALVGVFVVGLFVDVSPRVEGDFFFAEDDPQMQASREVAERFPGSAQVILRTEDLGGDSAAYRDRIEALTLELLAVEGITGGYSIANADPSSSPLFGRILLTPSAIGEAPATLETTGSSLFNRVWTLLGVPCVTLPFGTGPAGLPLGVQLVGAFDGDMKLLGWAHWAEAALRPGAHGRIN